MALPTGTLTQRLRRLCGNISALFSMVCIGYGIDNIARQPSATNCWRLISSKP